MIQGTIHNHIQRVLSQFSPFKAFQDREIDTQAYLRFLESNHGVLEAAGLDEDQMHLSSRFPHDEESKVDAILLDLKASGIISSTSYPKKEFENYREKVYATYDHGTFSTYIFPDEERLLYALAFLLQPQSTVFLGSYYGYWGIWAMPAIRQAGGKSWFLDVNPDEERLLYALAFLLQPQSTVFLGSYYGYWGIWAMPAIQQAGGKSWFLDVNPDVNALAAQNFAEMGFAEHSEFLTQDGIEYCQTTDQLFDWVVLDAECPKDHPNPEFRGKGIYGPLTQAVLPRLHPGASMVVHNILLENTIADTYFDNKIEKNKKELAKYIALTMDRFSFSKGYNTTEGTGIYKMPMGNRVN